MYTGILPLNQVLGPATEIAEFTSQARTEAKARRLRQETPADIIPAARAPAIDGKLDDVWKSAKPHPIANSMYEPPKSPRDLSAEYKAMWDEDNLYLLVEVTDDILKHDTSPEDWYDSDSVEVYIDATDSKSAQYGPTDYQYGFSWDKISPQMQEHQHSRTNGVQYALVTTDTGYRCGGQVPVVNARRETFRRRKDRPGYSGERQRLRRQTQEPNSRGMPRRITPGNIHRPLAMRNSPASSAGGSLTNPRARPPRTAAGGTTTARWLAMQRGPRQDRRRRRAGWRTAALCGLPTSPLLTWLTQTTIACWVNIHSVPAEWMSIVTKGDSAWRLSTHLKDRIFISRSMTGTATMG